MTTTRISNRLIRKFHLIATPDCLITLHGKPDPSCPSPPRLTHKNGFHFANWKSFSSSRWNFPSFWKHCTTLSEINLLIHPLHTFWVCRACILRNTLLNSPRKPGFSYSPVAFLKLQSSEALTNTIPNSVITEASTSVSIVNLYHWTQKLDNEQD